MLEKGLKTLFEAMGGLDRKGSEGFQADVSRGGRRQMFWLRLQVKVSATSFRQRKWLT
jgi:hypothetical protein